jgi:hypothetical protein
MCTASIHAIRQYLKRFLKNIKRHTKIDDLEMKYFKVDLG